MHSNSPSPYTPLFDRLGLMLGSACLVHCLLLPVAAVLLPSFAGFLPDHHLMHILLLAIALPISSLALIQGWRRGRDRLAPVMGAVGLSLLVVGVMVGQTHEVPVTIIGSLLLVIAHGRNWRVRTG